VTRRPVPPRAPAWWGYWHARTYPPKTDIWDIPPKPDIPDNRDIWDIWDKPDIPDKRDEPDKPDISDTLAHLRPVASLSVESPS